MVTTGLKDLKDSTQEIRYKLQEQNYLISLLTFNS
jgi:hypothetical protein